MASSENSYAKHAANFRDLIILLETLGTDYKPPQPTFEIKALTQLSKDAEEASRVVSNVLPIYARAVDEQQLIFSPLNSLITKSFNYLKVASTQAASLQTAKTLADRLRGFANGKRINEDGTVRSRQASTSYDSRIENLNQYIEVLATYDAYKPAEKEIAIDTFKALLDNMKKSTTAVIHAKIPLDDARKKRFELFYASPNGLIDIALGVKTYIRIILDKHHPQYKPIINLSFKRVSANS